MRKCSETCTKKADAVTFELMQVRNDTLVRKLAVVEGEEVHRACIQVRFRDKAKDREFLSTTECIPTVSMTRRNDKIKREEGRGYSRARFPPTPTIDASNL